MSFSETIFLFFLALIIFGPKKLPEIARQVGKALNEFRRASNEFKAQIEQEIAHLEVEGRQTILPPTPAPEGTANRALNSPSIESSQVPQEAPDANPADIAEVPASLAAPLDESASPTKSAEPTTEALPTGEAVVSATSQESHA